MDFIPQENKSRKPQENITERLFHGYWEHTNSKDKEQRRFDSEHVDAPPLREPAHELAEAVADDPEDYDFPADDRDPFDYERIRDATLRERAREHAEMIRGLFKEYSTRGNSPQRSPSICEIGYRLREMRDALGVSLFNAWRDSELNVTRVTSQKYMRAADRFGHLDKDVLARFCLTAMYELVTKKATDAAVDWAIVKAQAGGTISHRAAVRACRAQRRQPQPSPNGQLIPNPPQRTLPCENSATMKDVLQKTGRYIVEIGKRFCAME